MIRIIVEYNKPRAGKKKKRWSVKYKKSINCSNPKGFSQKAYCKRKARGGDYKNEGKEHNDGDENPQQKTAVGIGFHRFFFSRRHNDRPLKIRSEFGKGKMPEDR